MRIVNFIRSSIKGRDALFDSVPFAFLARIVGVGAGFLLTVVVSRFLGAEGAGLFYLALTVLTGASVVVRFGLDNALMRSASTALERKSLGTLVADYLISVGIILLLGIVVSGCIFYLSDFIATAVFDYPALSRTLRVASFGIVPMSLVFVHSGILKGLRRPVFASLVETGTIPMLAICFILLANFRRDLDPRDTMAAYVLALFFSVCVGLAFLRVTVPSRLKPAPSHKGVLAKAAATMMAVAVFNYMITWTPSILLGIFERPESVGFFNVANRTATLMSFVLVVVNSVTAPKFAGLHIRNDNRGIEAISLRSGFAMILLVSPLLIIFALFPRQILSVFGTDFSAAAPILMILAVGQFVNVATGSVGFILIMTGHENTMRNITAFSAIFSVLLNLLLIQLYGVIGAAIATAIGLATQNLIAAWSVYRVLGINVLAFRRLRAP